MSWQVLEERIGGVAKASYVWSPVYVDALVARDRNADGSSANGLEERLYALADANYNVTALVSASGGVVERLVSDPYGVASVLDAAGVVKPAGSGYAWVYRHQGGRQSAVSGLVSFRHREYSPTLKRWVQTDPIRFAAGDVNLYRSVGNGPVNRVDPSGLQSYLPGWNPYAPPKGGTGLAPPVGRPSLPPVPPGLPSKVFGPDGHSIPACPATLDEWEKIRRLPGFDGWKDLKWVTIKYHPGATVTVRLVYTNQKCGNQCAYDKDGKLITGGSGAGTPDKYQTGLNHSLFDVLPWDRHHIPEYHHNWPPFNHPDAETNVVDIPPPVKWPGIQAPHSYIPNFGK